MTITAGVLLILIAVAIVAWPLLKRTGFSELLEPEEDAELTDLVLQKSAAFSAIDELDSDYAMGDLSSGDYGELRKKYEEKAVSIMRDIDGLQNEEDEEIELEVLKLRRKEAVDKPEVSLVCTGCGAELAAGDSFCSHCGEKTRPTCPHCASKADVGDRFCPQCGGSLGEQGHV